MMFRKCLALLLIVILTAACWTQNKAKAEQEELILMATPKCGSVELIWRAIPGATSYYIYRGLSKGGEEKTPLTDFPIASNHFTDTVNIQDGMQYFYFVKALGSNAEEFMQSNDAFATPRCKPESPVEDVCSLILTYQVGNSHYWVGDVQKPEMETPPEITAGRMFLLVKYVVNEIGAALTWEPMTKTAIIATLEGTIIEIQVGNQMAKINGVLQQIDPNNPKVAAYIKNGRTLLPMRFLAENLGATKPDGVKWMESSKKVILKFKKPECLEKPKSQVMSTQVDLCSWRCFRGNPMHNGAAFNMCGELATKLTKKWEYKTGGAIKTSPIVAFGKVYASSSDKKIYCIDASTGAKVWNSTAFSGDLTSSPCFDNGSIYFGRTTNKLTRLNCDTGALEWSATDGYWVESSPVVFGDKVFFGYSQGIMALKSSNTMAKVWDFKTTKMVTSSPALTPDGKKLYCGSDDGKMYCLNSETGGLIWSFNVGAQIKTSPSYMDDKIYFGADNGYFYCIFATTGIQYWKVKFPNSIRSSAVAAGTCVYFGCNDGNLYCLNATNGKQNWKLLLGNRIESSPAFVQGVLAVGVSYDAGGQELVLVDAIKGTKLWSQLGCGGESSPAFAGGKLFVGSKDGKIYCFGADESIIGYKWGRLRDLFDISFPVIQSICGWPCNGGNASRTSSVGSSCSPTKDALVEKWSYEDSSQCRGDVIVSEGKALYQLASGLLCLDAETGLKLWKNTELTDSHTNGGSTPVLADGKVYNYGGPNGWLYCLDAVNGKRLWWLPTISTVETDLIYSSGKLFFAMKNPQVDKTHLLYFCLDASTQNIDWQFDATPEGFESWGSVSFSSVAISGGSLFFTVRDSLVCLDALTGQKKWDVKKSNGSSPMVYDGKVVLSGSVDDLLYCYNASNGAFLWKHSIGSTRVNSGACTGDGKVFFTTIGMYGYNSPDLKCLELATGKLLWSVKQDVIATPAYCKNKLYAVGSHNNLYCFDAGTGNKLWDAGVSFYDYSHPYPASSSPAITNSKIYYKGNDFKIHCYKDAP